MNTSMIGVKDKKFEKIVTVLQYEGIKATQSAERILNEIVWTPSQQDLHRVKEHDSGVPKIFCMKS